MKKLLLIFAIVLAGFFAKGQVVGYTVEAFDYILLNSDTIRFDSPSDGEYLKRVGGVWENGSGGTGTAAVDSLIWNISSGYLGWYIGGSVSDSISLDDRYIEIADSTDGYVTPADLASSLTGAQTVVFSITLPVNGTLAGSIAAAVEGTDYDTGWVLSSSGVNLQINHGLGRYATAIKVHYNISGSSYRQLRDFDNAYSGILNVDDDNVTVEGLSEFYTAYAFKIYITLE